MFAEALFTGFSGWTGYCRPKVPMSQAAPSTRKLDDVPTCPAGRLRIEHCFGTQLQAQSADHPENGAQRRIALS